VTGGLEPVDVEPWKPPVLSLSCPERIRMHGGGGGNRVTTSAPASGITDFQIRKHWPLPLALNVGGRNLHSLNARILGPGKMAGPARFRTPGE